MHDAIRSDLVKIAKTMYDKQMLNAYEGNVSIKVDDRIYITPSSVCKGFLTEDMLVAVDAQGNVVEAQGKYVPSSETKLHLECYRLRPDITSVVHNHSPFATAFAIANMPIQTRAYSEMIIAFDTIPVVPYGTPSTPEVYDGLSKYIHTVDTFMIGNHGIVAVGSDVYDAFFKIEAAESIAKSLTIARLLGGESPIPDHQIEVLYRIRKEKFGRDKLEL